MKEKEILESLISGLSWSSESGVGKVGLKKVLKYIKQLEKEKQELKEWLEEEIKNAEQEDIYYLDEETLKEVLERLEE